MVPSHVRVLPPAGDDIEALPTISDAVDPPKEPGSLASPTAPLVEPPAPLVLRNSTASAESSPSDASSPKARRSELKKRGTTFRLRKPKKEEAVASSNGIISLLEVEPATITVSVDSAGQHTVSWKVGLREMGPPPISDRVGAGNAARRRRAMWRRAAVAARASRASRGDRAALLDETSLREADEEEEQTLPAGSCVARCGAL